MLYHTNGNAAFAINAFSPRQNQFHVHHQNLFKQITGTFPIGFIYTSSSQNEDHVSISDKIPEWTRLDPTIFIVIIVVKNSVQIGVTLRIGIYVKFKR
jgi:hypothetical protein